MRKLVFIALVSLMVLSLTVSGCQKATPEPTAVPPTATTAAVKPTATPVPPTPVPPTAEPTKVLKVGLVTDVGKVDDGTFNQYAYEGMMQAVKEFGLESAFIETQQSTDYEKNAQQFVDEGFDLVITVGFMFGDTTLKMAQKYPEIVWFGVDQGWAEYPANLAGPIFREDQSGFMAGALAGLMTQSKTVGIVAGMEIAPVIKFRNGYENGVKYVCGDCTTTGVYIDSFTDPARGKAAAESQIAEGADVIFGAGGPTGSGGILGAAQQGVWVLGVDQDEYFTTFKGGAEAGSDKLLSSAMKRVDLSTYTAVKDFVEGNFKSGAWNFEASNEGIALAPFHGAEAAVSADVRAALDKIYAALASGELQTGSDPVTGALIPEQIPAPGSFTS
jgi:basic membrane protein A